MLFDVPIHELSAGGKSLLQGFRNKSGASAASSAHLGCNLRLRDGGRHLLLGKNGCGKTTLLRAVRDGLPGAPNDVKTFLVDQELALLNLQQTVLATVLSADSHRYDLQNRRQYLEQLLEAQADQEAIEEASTQLSAVYEELAQVEDDAVCEQRARAILAGLGFSPLMMEFRVHDLSGGWRMRCALAAALFTEPQLLMLDEPTNHLDMPSIRWLQRYLVEHYTGSKTLLCVSHDRSFINAVLTDIVVIQGQALVNYAGSLEEFEIAAEQMSQHLKREAEVLQKKRAAAQVAIDKHVAREQRSMNNKAENILHNRYGDGQALLYGSAQSGKVTALNRKLERTGMEKTLDGKRFKASEHGFRLGSLEDNEGEGESRALAAAPLFQKEDPMLKFGFKGTSRLGVLDGMPILQVEEVSFCFPGQSAPVLASISLSVSGKSRIAVVGANGSGKSTLVSLMIGGLEPSAGQVWRHRNLKIAHLSQHEADELQALTTTPLAYLQGCFPAKKDLELRKLLGSFGVQGSMATQALNTLSGGQRVRVAFAKICAEQPQLLVLDEPTNHLDIYSIDALTDALRSFEGAVILVTHNQSMLKNIAEEVILVRHGSCVSAPIGTDPHDKLLSSLCEADAGQSGGGQQPSKKRSAAAAHPARPSLSVAAAAALAESEGIPTEGSGKPGVQRRAVAVPPAPRAGMPLRCTEKEFLKCAKRVREMLRIEELKANGSITKSQEEKLQRKSDAINELADALQYLSGDSDLHEKNEDLIKLVPNSMPTVEGAPSTGAPRHHIETVTRLRESVASGLHDGAAVCSKAGSEGCSTDQCSTSASEGDSRSYAELPSGSASDAPFKALLAATFSMDRVEGADNGARGAPPGTGNRRTHRRAQQRRLQSGAQCA